VIDLKNLLAAARAVAAEDMARWLNARLIEHARKAAEADDGAEMLKQLGAAAAIGAAADSLRGLAPMPATMVAVRRLALDGLVDKLSELIEYLNEKHDNGGNDWADEGLGHLVDEAEAARDLLRDDL
jgi:hypothetical protein